MSNAARVCATLVLIGVAPAPADTSPAVNPLDKRQTTGFEIEGDIDRSAFGVTKFVPSIGNTVHLAINGAFERK